jgi:hypothetical protein
MVVITARPSWCLALTLKINPNNPFDESGLSPAVDEVAGEEAFSSTYMSWTGTLSSKLLNPLAFDFLDIDQWPSLTLLKRGYERDMIGTPHDGLLVAPATIRGRPRGVSVFVAVSSFTVRARML